MPIGRPISNSQVYVLDRYMNPVPVGVRGEIYVGGDGLALGYWRQPELTAERFVKNPIAPELSEKLYRTGDLGRWRSSGEIEYLGRMDSEVKVRGMRIELGEIETVLGTHAWVEEAVVELSGEGAEQRLVAYVVGGEGEAPSARELRRHVRTKLPEHMVPAGFVRVEEMPLLTSGKVNRRGLNGVAGFELREQGEIAKAQTEVEKKLEGMWAEVLKVKEVGVDQNFFEIGGHSLLVLQVMARIRREFGVELGVRTMFEEATIVGLASEVEKALAAGKQVQTPVLERRVSGRRRMGMRVGRRCWRNWTRSRPKTFRACSNAYSMRNHANTFQISPGSLTPVRLSCENRPRRNMPIPLAIRWLFDSRHGAPRPSHSALPILAGAGGYLFLRLLLATLSNSWTHWPRRHSSGQHLSSGSSCFGWLQSRIVVCPQFALAVERSAYADGSVLGGPCCITAITHQCLAAWHVGDLFCVLSFLCQRGAGFFWVSIGRDVARSWIYFFIFCPTWIPSRLGSSLAAITGQFVSPAMGMVSNLLRVRCREDHWRRP